MIFARTRLYVRRLSSALPRCYSGMRGRTPSKFGQLAAWCVSSRPPYAARTHVYMSARYFICSRTKRPFPLTPRIFCHLSMNTLGRSPRSLCSAAPRDGNALIAMVSSNSFTRERLLTQGRRDSTRRQGKRRRSRRPREQIRDVVRWPEHAGHRRYLPFLAQVLDD